MYQRKDYKDLKFTDDFMFCKILTDDLELCRKVLELILGIEIRKVVLSESQKAVDETYDGKGVRFDVYVADEDETVYDIEMQTTRYDGLPKRTRYYQGMLDLNLLAKGQDYEELKNSYIIFICLGDPFHSNLPVYTFENLCLQNREISLGDGTRKVFINAQGSRIDQPKEFVAFLDYLKNGETNSELTRILDCAVKKAILKEEWEVEYMTLAMKLNEERKEGREEGRLEERLYFAVQMLKQGFSDEQILSLGVTDEQLQEAKNLLAAEES